MSAFEVWMANAGGKIYEVTIFRNGHYRVTDGAFSAIVSRADLIFNFTFIGDL